MRQTFIGLAAVLLPFVVAGIVEWRRNRRAFRKLPPPDPKAVRSIETQAVP